MTANDRSASQCHETSVRRCVEWAPTRTFAYADARRPCGTPPNRTPRPPGDRHPPSTAIHTPDTPRSPGPPRTASTRNRIRRATRHCLHRHTAEQYTARAATPALSRTPHPASGPLPLEVVATGRSDPPTEGLPVLAEPGAAVMPPAFPPPARATCGPRPRDPVRRPSADRERVPARTTGPWTSRTGVMPTDPRAAARRAGSTRHQLVIAVQRGHVEGSARCRRIVGRIAVG